MATGFVGRAVELGRLAEALRTAGSGVPCIVHVQGAAGIGKTTLVRHFLAAQQGLAVLEASGDENETELPYGVLSQLTGEACPAERDAIAAGAGLLEHLGRLQDDGPVVLVLDDVQWADMLSLSAVTFALRRLRADQVLSIVIARDRAEAALPNGLRRLLQDDRTVRLSLGGLSAADLRAFGGPALSGAAAERLCAFTGGNVLHARELMERLPVGALNDLTRPLPAPHGFAALILARFAACGTHTRDFVGAASVLATPCPIGRIGALAGTEPLAAFEEAAGAGLLEERTTELGLCAAFPHPLVQVAIYQGLGVVARHRFHARATGQVTGELERLHHRVRAAAGPSPELADDLAAFARKEQRTGQWSSAGTHFVQAARLVDEPARRAGLIGEAVGPLVHAGRVEEAAELTRTLPPECPPEVRCFAQGVLAQVAGRSQQATRLLTEAWDRTDTTTDPGLAVRTAEQLAILTMMSSDAAEATKWAERALSVTSAGLDTRIVRSVQVLALAALGFPEKALETTAHLPSAQTATPEGRDLLVGRGTVRSWAGDLDGAIGDLAGLLRGADRLSAFQRVVVHAHLGHALHLRGEWDDAVIHGEISTILAEEGDQVWMAGGARGLAALVPAKRGEWATAEHHVAEGRRAAGEILASRFYVAVAEGWLSASRGDSDRVLRVLLPILDLGARNGIDEPGSLDWRDLLSDALLSVGEVGKAEQILDPFERRALDRGRHMSLVRVWRAKGNLLAARQDFSGAAEAFERGVRDAERSPVPFDKAWLDLDYGCFLRRHGSRNAAAERLETAQRTFATLRAAPYLERCGRELAACGGAAGVTSRPWNLTAREQAVARLVATGKSNQRTARELMLSVKTIEYHLGHVYAKLGVTNRAELAARFAAGGP